MLQDVLNKWGAVEVAPIELYTDVFHLGEGMLQKERELPGEFKTNPIALCSKDGKMFRRILFEDRFEEILEELKEADFAFLNGCTYFGRTNAVANVSKMYALIFDLDGVTDKTLNAFFSGAFNAKAYPIPNYVVLSGHGVHLYYLFEYPVPLYPNIKLQLKKYKYALTTRVWNAYTSTIEKPQYQGINQSFRIPGTKTKEGSKMTYAVPYRLHNHPFCFDELNEFVPEEDKIDETKLYKESSMTLNEAAKKYPEWYQKRVIEKQPKGTYTCKKDLYDWWIRKIREGAAYHHRYFCIMCLCIYAVKCGVSEEELREDIKQLMPFLNELNPDEPFTETDVESALDCFEERYKTFPRNDISKLSGIVIKANKRNGRTQEVHLGRARAVQMYDDPEGKWRNKEGRPSAEQIVREYRETHPEARKTDCIRETGLSKPTVYKWWDETSGPKVSKKVFSPVRKSKTNYLVKQELLKMLLSMDDDEVAEFYRMIDGDSEKKVKKGSREMTPEEAAEYERMIKHAEQMVLEETIEGFKL